MAKLVLILLCCFVWVEAEPFFFNIQKSYVSQPTQTTVRPVRYQSTNVGTSGIFSKWLLLSQIFTNKLLGVPTQRPRPTQRPVVQIDPVYKPVDLDKEPVSEVPAEEISTTRKTTTSTTEYITSSSTRRTTTSSSFTESTPLTSEATTEAETLKPTTYRPVTTTSTQRPTTQRPTTQRPTTTPAPTTTTTTTTTTEKTDSGFEIDSGEQEKPIEIIETSSSATSTTWGGYEYNVPAQPVTLPPVMTIRRVATVSAGQTSTGSISSGVKSANTASTAFRFSGAAGEAVSTDVSSSSSTSGNGRPFNIVSFRGSIADNIAGEGLLPDAKSVEVSENLIDPRVFYY